MVAAQFFGFLLPGVALAQVSMFPVTTQTNFPMPECTGGASATEEFTVNYNFETVERAMPVTAVTPIGEYNLLSFKNIQWVGTDPDKDGNHLGLAPHTYPDVATFGAGLNSLLDTTPQITANYSQSTLSSFSPISWWYGCVLPSPISAGSLPITCNITATGYDKAGLKVVSQDFHFKANGSVVQDQNFGAFKGFKNIYTLGFSVQPGTSAAALIDNFIAKLEQKSCAPFYLGSYNNGT